MRTLRTVCLVLVGAAVAEQATEHVVHAVAAGGVAGVERTKRISVTSSANVRLWRATDEVPDSEKCINTTTAPVYIVEENAADTTDGDGPYCTSCDAGPIVKSRAHEVYARTSSGTATLQCGFLDNGADFGGAGGGGLSSTTADGSYFRLDGTNGPITGNLAVNGNTTLGNASGDTFTLNAASTTFANDETVTLAGTNKKVVYVGKQLTLRSDTTATDPWMTFQNDNGTDTVWLQYKNNAGAGAVCNGQAQSELCLRVKDGKYHVSTNNGTTITWTVGDQVVGINDTTPNATLDITETYGSTLTLRDSDGVTKQIDVTSTGSMLGKQSTSGTMETWRVPTGIANALPTKPACATSANAGQIIYVDDSNDTAVAMLCVCRAGADDATYSWVQVADNSSACL